MSKVHVSFKIQSNILTVNSYFEKNKSQVKCFQYTMVQNKYFHSERYEWDIERNYLLKQM